MAIFLNKNMCFVQKPEKFAVERTKDNLVRFSMQFITTSVTQLWQGKLISSHSLPLQVKRNCFFCHLKQPVNHSILDVVTPLSVLKWDHKFVFHREFISLFHKTLQTRRRHPLAISVISECMKAARRVKSNPAFF